MRSLLAGTLVCSLSIAAAAEGCGTACPTEAAGCPPAATAAASSEPGSTAERVRLAALLKEPQRWRDRPVILEGHFVQLCCAGCFTYKEGLDAIEVHTAVSGWERFAPGTPVRLTGWLRVAEKRTNAGSSRTRLSFEASRVERR
ncbi:MAG: hypothetical protein NZ552_01785 [Planctomycetes bacterium]|nr:hypothetical protein [Planctomycetota bacterium]